MHSMPRMVLVSLLFVGCGGTAEKRPFDVLDDGGDDAHGDPGEGGPAPGEDASDGDDAAPTYGSCMPTLGLMAGDHNFESTCKPMGPCPSCGPDSWLFECPNDGLYPTAPTPVAPACTVLVAGIDAGPGKLGTTTACCPKRCIQVGPDLPQQAACYDAGFNEQNLLACPIGADGGVDTSSIAGLYGPTVVAGPDHWPGYLPLCWGH